MTYPDHLPPQSRARIRRLTHQVRQLQRAVVAADALIEIYDSKLEQLEELGLHLPSPLLGELVVWRAYGCDGPDESHELIQAGLIPDVGLAAVFWNSQEYENVLDYGNLGGQATDRARPLWDCAPAIRGLVLPHAERLIDLLLKRCCWTQTG